MKVPGRNNPQTFVCYGERKIDYVAKLKFSSDIHQRFYMGSASYDSHTGRRYLPDEPPWTVAAAQTPAAVGQIVKGAFQPSAVTGGVWNI